MSEDLERSTAAAVAELLPPVLSAPAPRPDALGHWMTKLETRLDPQERLALLRVRLGDWEAATLRPDPELPAQQTRYVGRGQTAIDALSELFSRLELREAHRPGGKR